MFTKNIRTNAVYEVKCALRIRVASSTALALASAYQRWVVRMSAWPISSLATCGLMPHCTSVLANSCRSWCAVKSGSMIVLYRGAPSFDFLPVL